METFDVAGQVFVTLVVMYLVRNAFRKREKPFLRSVAILVLGDIGRSPRMMYHAESFAQSNFQTYLIGYPGSTPIPSLERLNVELLHLTETPKMLRNVPFLLVAPVKIFIQVMSILCTLLIRIPHSPEFIMVQNPPSIPTLVIAQLVCRIRGCKLIIDWHNLGYSILALRLGADHPLVGLAKRIEYIFGRDADIHLFVTKAMKDKLVKEWDLQGIKQVFHDRPPSNFKRAEVFETHSFFSKLSPALSEPSLKKMFLPRFTPPESTPFTHLAPAQVTADSIALDTEISDSFVLFSSPSPSLALRPDRPALLVSSTSWTPDEDFSILLQALAQYERRAREANEGSTKSSGDIKPKKQLPKLLTIVTGKGPLKESYMSQITDLEKKEDWRWVRCRSLWLEAEDYPVLLGSADLGVCLHTSSSKLDLPMKVVDMFGCGLPVCALDFECLDELVQDGKNGHIFKKASDLADQIEKLLRGFPKAPALTELRSSFDRNMRCSYHHESVGGTEWKWGSWSQNWDNIFKPLLLTDLERARELERAR